MSVEQFAEWLARVFDVEPTNLPERPAPPAPAATQNDRERVIEALDQAWLTAPPTKS